VKVPVTSRIPPATWTVPEFVNGAARKVSPDEWTRVPEFVIEPVPLTDDAFIVRVPALASDPGESTVRPSTVPVDPFWSTNWRERDPLVLQLAPLAIVVVPVPEVVPWFWE
jgi:hypothetical protein